MGNYTLEIPDELYQQAQRMAETSNRSVNRVLLHHLQTLSEPFALLPPDERAELEALRYLSDDALWTIAGEQLPHDLQTQMQLLQERHSFGLLSPDELQTLETLVERGNRLMVRKAEASGILIERGNTLS